MTDWPVRIIRSERRRRTVQARFNDGRIEVRVPASLDPTEESRIVEEIVAKVKRKHTSSRADLAARATYLARKHDLPEAQSIVWSSRQNLRWGSCTPTDGRIRISDRLAEAPGWVVDSVIVHELAHIVVANHGPAFQELVRRYELTERARGYLMAMSEGRTDR